MSIQGSCEFNFLPESYALPDERQALQKAMKAGDDLWIVKVLHVNLLVFVNVHTSLLISLVDMG